MTGDIHDPWSSGSLMRSVFFEFLAAFISQVRDSIKAMMVQLVLGTDMRQHFQLVAQFKAKLGICGAAKNASVIGSSRRTSAMTRSHRGSMEMPPPEGHHVPTAAAGLSRRPVAIGQSLAGSQPEGGPRDPRSAPQPVPQEPARQQEPGVLRRLPSSEGEMEMIHTNAQPPRVPMPLANPASPAPPEAPVNFSRNSSVPSSIKSVYGSTGPASATSITLDTLMPLDDDLKGLVLKVRRRHLALADFDSWQLAVMFI